MHSRFSLLTHATYCSSALHCTMDCSPLRILLGMKSHLPGKCFQLFCPLHPTPYVSPVSVLQILSVTAVSTAVPSRWKNLSGSGCSRRALTLCGASHPMGCRRGALAVQHPWLRYRPGTWASGCKLKSTQEEKK